MEGAPLSPLTITTRWLGRPLREPAVGPASAAPVTMVLKLAVAVSMNAARRGHQRGGDLLPLALLALPAPTPPLLLLATALLFT